MAAVQITRLEHTPAALRALAKGRADAAQTHRLLAIALVLEGASRAEAARQTGMDRQTLRDWVHRHNEAGPPGLCDRKRDGRPPKLPPTPMTDLRELVVAGPDPDQHTVIRWRCVDWCGEVARRFAVSRPERTIGQWLRKLDLTRLRPRPHPPRKTAEAQTAFKKLCRPLSGNPAGNRRKQTARGLVSGRSQGRAAGHADLRVGREG